MKRLIFALLAAILLCSFASAEGWSSFMGGLSSLFSSDDEITYGIGEDAEVDELTLKLVNVMTSKGNSYYKPDNGMEYVILEFEIENGSDEDIVLSTMMNFTCWCDDTTSEINVEALAMAMLSGKYQLDCAIEPGQKVRGVVGYEVPADWETIKIEFRKEILFGASITFQINKSDK